MFLCCQKSSYSDNEDDDVTPIQARNYRKNSQQTNNSKTGKTHQGTENSCLKIGVSEVRSLVSNRTYKSQQQLIPLIDKNAFLSTIESLKTHNNNKKISINRKRQNYTQKFIHLQNRVDHLKNQFSLKQKAMKDIQNRINKFIEQDAKVSHSTEVADQSDFLVK